MLFSHILEQMVWVSWEKKTPTHLGSRGHKMVQRSCLTAQRICSRGNNRCPRVSNIANRCSLSFACSNGSLLGTSKWQRMKLWSMSCISVPFIFHTFYISCRKSQDEPLSVLVLPEIVAVSMQNKTDSKLCFLTSLFSFCSCLIKKNQTNKQTSYSTLTVML